MQQLQYILAHEYIHICRCDALTKLVCILHSVSTGSTRWCGSCMYFLTGCGNFLRRTCCAPLWGERKICVCQNVNSDGGKAQQCYDIFAAWKWVLFKIGKNAMEERITAIMKIKKEITARSVAGSSIGSRRDRGLCLLCGRQNG